MHLPALCFFALLVHSCRSARILGIVGTASYSHQVPFQPLWRELSLRGHQVVVLTTDPVKDPSLTNLTEVDLHGAYDIWRRMDIMDLSNMLPNFEAVLKTVEDVQEYELSHPEVQRLIHDQSQAFDLVMVEPFSPAMLGFAVRFNCPHIHLFSLDANIASYHLVGNPAHPVLNPDFMLPLSGKLNFFERLLSSSSIFIWAYLGISKIVPSSNRLIKKHFGEDYPAMRSISRNVSLMFVNTDNVFHPVRPLLPSVIQIGGGTHLKPPKPLPKDLQVVLDKSVQGAIYFSFGTNVKLKNLSEQKRRAIVDVLAELPYTVLWKSETKTIANLSNNVVLSKWFPQQDVLRHPNVRLFITQGGLQSMEEAVYSGVPIVGIPFIADQFANVKRIAEKGVGLGLDYNELTRKTFKEAILEVISNPEYRSKVKAMAELAQDQPMTGLEKAVWWTEYVLRHKGAKHLRSPAMDLPSYQYFLIDVLAFCSVVLLTMFYILYTLMRFSFKILRYLRSRSKLKVA